MKLQSPLFFYTACVIGSILLLSCNKSQNVSDAYQSQDTKTVPDSANLAPSSLPNKETSNSVSSQTIPTLNPPHGEPGHRCDIPVNARLDSPPTQSGSQIINTTEPQDISVEQSQSVNQKSNPPSNNIPVQKNRDIVLPPGSINPPHGQPGHKCNIEVGQPLP